MLPPQVNDDQSDQQPTVWQRAWVQKVLPLITSLSAHAGILVIGIAIALSAGKLADEPLRDQDIIPTGDLSPIPSGIPNLGILADPTRAAAQDQETDEAGWVRKPGPSLTITDAGGGNGDDYAGNIQIGPGGKFGGKSTQLGSGQFDGSGSGAEGGTQAPWGIPGGLNVTPCTLFTCCGGNVRRIAFVCDASGSMVNKMAMLKSQLSLTIRKLKPSQTFDVIFFQNKSCDSFSKLVEIDGLVSATPSAKLAFAGPNGFLEGIVSAGVTDPIPGIEQAFKSHPHLIYLLTDGDFPDNDAVLRKIDELRKTEPRVKINTIAFTGEGDKDTAFLAVLKQIAAQSGGVFRHVKENDIASGGK